MGNVHAAESAASPAAPEADRNPGTMEDLHKKCKDVFPMYFEGCKFLVNKGLSNNFQVSHTLTMSNTVPSGYRQGADQFLKHLCRLGY
jgi:mitochondrial import receptor subunit TOM40